MTEKINLTLTIPDNLGGTRLDQALAKLLPDFSRTQIQEWIKNALVTVDNKHLKAKDLVIGGEEILINAARKVQPTWEAQPIELAVVYEDDALLVINKPVGMVVHPAAGNLDNTLLNALLHHVPDLLNLPRAGIIHRLDKDTSGLLVIAKTHAALIHLSKQMKARSISRIYQAVVNGILLSGGTVDEPIGRHPIQRKRMTVIETGKPAVTHYRVVEKYRDHTRIKVQLETGRTHQIRVHMTHIRHPLLGDQIYGGRLQLPRGASPELIEQLRKFKRQALHASELGLIHPVTQKEMCWQAPLPDDMQNLIKVLRSDARLSLDEDFE
jgi:23S rRNA pseudouridine1911/1915/1917 synthase